MYGLVNQAVEDLVRTQFGDAAWHSIKTKAGITDERFIGMYAYPDDVTYRMVDAASEVLNLPSATVLDAFGEYWVRYTAREGYGDLLAMAGSDVPTFLHNLNDLHTRVGLLMPHLQPPAFACTDVEPGSLRFHYYSERRGLAPMVTGLLRGLGTLLGTSLTATLVEQRELGADHDVWQIDYERGDA